MLNRGAVMLRGKQPFVDWINSSAPKAAPEISEEMLNQERTVYLISEEDAENIERFIGWKYKELFRHELSEWNTDESTWPKRLAKAMFHDWFEVECHPVILDTVGTELYDDEV